MSSISKHLKTSGGTTSRDTSRSSPVRPTSKHTSSSSPTTTASRSASSTPAPSTCGNQGLQWGYWYNPYPHNSTPRGWPNYDPAYTDITNPEYTGVVPALIPLSLPRNQSSAGFYSQFTGDAKNFTLNHQGYIWAARNGTYTFAVSGVDDNFNLWLGDTAFGYPYEAWDRRNADVDVYSSAGVTGAASHGAHLTGGTWNTLRFTIAQAGGSAGLRFRVFDPEGQDMFPPDSVSPNLVQQACSGDTAPGGDRFQAFGYNYQKMETECLGMSGCVDDFGECVAPGCSGTGGKCVPLGEGCDNTENCAAQSGCIGADQQCVAPGCYLGSGEGRTCVALGQSGCNTPVG